MLLYYTVTLAVSVYLITRQFDDNIKFKDIPALFIYATFLPLLIIIGALYLLKDKTLFAKKETN
jgi:hypothetical protein